ncbi:hypothetical protein BY998_11715 [Methylobacterium sp. B4]|nr:hypothetical protein BY998_11715 [Methylobacterium sp. B4]
MWTTVTTQITASPSKSGGAPGRTALAYCPNAIAASATGAAKPTVAESHPAMNPTAGPYRRVRKLYSPLDRGNIVASSA